MKAVTKAQITKIHVLLNQLGYMDQKKAIMARLTSGRTESTRELSFEEARHLISQLVEHSPLERKKSLIFSLAYRCGIIYGSTSEDRKINTAKLDLFLKERGAVKKSLNAMNFSELTSVHRQFEAILRSNERSRENKKVNQAVGSLLDELGIPTSGDGPRKKAVSHHKQQKG